MADVTPTPSPRPAALVEAPRLKRCRRAAPPVRVRIGKSDRYVTLDSGDYILLSRYSLRFIGTGYVGIRGMVNGKEHNYVVSRLLTGCPPDKVVDHINGDRLDNRRCNLRVCSNAENTSHRTVMNSNNTSGAAGVYRRKGTGRWRAVYGINGRMVHLGTYDTMEEAVAVRTAALLKAAGQYAPTENALRQRSRG